MTNGYGPCQRVRVLTEFFASTETDALALLDTGPANSQFVTAELKSIDPVLIGTLWAAIRDGDITAYTLATHDPLLPLLASGAEEGPWLSQLRDEFTRDLAELPDERVPAVAGAWTRAREWYGSPAPDALAGIVTMLRDVARAAGSGHMYLWICL
jgi:hypothetical protein